MFVMSMGIIRTHHVWIPRNIFLDYNRKCYSSTCVGLYSSCLLRVFDLHFDFISQGLLWYM